MLIVSGRFRIPGLCLWGDGGESFGGVAPLESRPYPIYQSPPSLELHLAYSAPASCLTRVA